MEDITTLFSRFKSKVEFQTFAEKQHLTITSLLEKNTLLIEEIRHLKELLASTTQLIGGQELKVERIILTPEEALIDAQIEMLQSRGMTQEATLEDVKKLDLLIKNKRLVREQSTTIQGESAKPDRRTLSTAELIQIASKKPDNNVT